MKESDIQKQIFNYCTQIAENKNIMFFSIPNESAMTVLKMFGIESSIVARIINHFKAMGLVPGIPDTGLMFSGNTYYFEVKKPDEDATDNQKRVHEKNTSHRSRSFYSEKFR
jgi:hypothetical protein